MTHRITPLARAIHLAFATSLTLCSLAGTNAALAQPAASSIIRFDIDAAPLDQAISQFGRQAGIPLSIDASLTAGKASPGVKGSFSVGQGFARLLAGTGLNVFRTDSGNYLLTQAAESSGALELGVTSINSRLLGKTTEGTGSYTTGVTNTATKMNLSIRETPQSISVITRQRMQDQGMTTLNDVVKNAPGLTLTQWGAERPRFNSRGFGIENIMFDGLPVGYEEAALSTGALAMYDRVEIVRGAAGLMEGAGLPSGSINLVRKRPTVAPQVILTGSYGTWDNRRFELDAGSALNAQGTLRGRTVLSYQKKDSFTDYSSNERTLLYGIIEADLNEDTTVSLGASYSGENNPGADWNGLGTDPSGTFLPISRSDRMSPAWSYWNKESKTVFADIEHRFDNGWKAKGAATYITSKMNMMGTFLSTPLVDANGDLTYSLRGGKYNYDRDQSSVDGYLSGPFEFAGRTHSLVVGASHRESDWHDVGGPILTNGSYEIIRFNPITWDPGALAKPGNIDMTLYNRKTTVEQTGVYTTARFSLADPLTLIVGGRVDWYEQEIKGNEPFKAVREVTPYAGLVYDLNETYSVYGSWTRIFQPQSLQTAGGTFLEPIQGTNYEIGLKGEHFGGRLNTSVALFQINLENLPDQLEASACTGGTTLCYEGSGEIRSRGIEFEVTGALTENWEMSASYTYNTAERIKESGAYTPIGSASKGDRYGTNLPANLFKLTTSYRLSGDLDQWRVGGAMRTQSKTYTQWGVQQGGYTIHDLFASYDVNQNLQLSVNLNNVFDKRYYSSISSTTGSNFFGDPRNATLNLRYEF